MILIKVIIAILLTSLASAASPVTLGFNITDMGGEFSYFPLENHQKTPAHVALDQIKNLGFSHAVLNIRAHMHGPRTADIVLVTASADEQKELQGLSELIAYGHSLGMTIGLRPIVLVLGPKGEFPYQEGDHLWWHGNINPNDRTKWFDAFEKFVLHYAEGLRSSGLDEFTIGAEMQSMMVGMGSGDSAYLMGQPERWLSLFKKIKAIHPQANVTYDINFPETLVPLTNNIGGEFERWRHLIVDLQNTRDSNLQLKRQALISLWTQMDFVGLDFYRYLSKSSQNLPKDFDTLVARLTPTVLSHATQIDNALADISLIIGTDKQLAIIEIGYRSVNYCFINPASYSDSGGNLNIMHQAASYKAIANGFLKPQWPWLRGIYFWDISVNPELNGPTDAGFSPLGKNQTLQVIEDDYVSYLKKLDSSNLKK